MDTFTVHASKNSDWVEMQFTSPTLTVAKVQAEALRFDQPRLVTLSLLARRPAERSPNIIVVGFASGSAHRIEEFGYLDLKAVAVAGQHLRCR
jgi:hypothetical protein